MTHHLKHCFIITILLLVKCTEQHSQNQADRSSRRDPDTISIAFYNVQNVFDVVDNGNEYPEYKVGRSNWNRDMLSIKLRNISSVMVSMDASVIGLCEIENRYALNELQRVLRYNGLTYKYTSIANVNGAHNTCTCLLSKFPIISERFIPVKLPDSTFSRDILEADILMNKTILKLFVNHWPSKLNPESFRIKAAEALESRIKELPRVIDYIVLGDLNSDYDECFKVKTSGLDDTNSKTALNDILRTAKIENGIVCGLNTESDIMKSTDKKHYDLWLEIPVSSRMSHFFAGNHQTPDHILLPSSLYDSLGISYIDNSFNVFTFDDKLLKDGKPFGWQFYWKKKTKLHLGTGYSDHLPIIARFINKPFQKHVPIDDFSEIKEVDSVELRCTANTNYNFNNSAWMLCNAKAQVQTGVFKNNKKDCIYIAGPVQAGNGCIARIVVDKKRRTLNCVRMEICGKGKLSIRLRFGKAKWLYYDLESRMKKKSARYSMINSSKWRSFEIGYENGEEDLEMELRTGKGQEYELWIGSVVF